MISIRSSESSPISVIRESRVRPSARSLATRRTCSSTNSAVVFPLPHTAAASSVDEGTARLASTRGVSAAGEGTGGVASSGFPAGWTGAVVASRPSAPPSLRVLEAGPVGWGASPAFHAATIVNEPLR